MSRAHRKEKMTQSVNRNNKSDVVEKLKVILDFPVVDVAPATLGKSLLTTIEFNRVN